MSFRSIRKHSRCPAWLFPRFGNYWLLLLWQAGGTGQGRSGSLPTAGANRLTIQVQLRFANTKDPKQDFEQTFQSQRDFASTQDIATINNDLASVRKITRIITDILNKPLANWQLPPGGVGSPGGRAGHG